jgi:hypothetical protein
MTKQEMIDKILGIPEDLIAAAYSFEIVQSTRIQMFFDAKILQRYHPGRSGATVDPNGFIKFEAEGVTICMT